MRRLLQRRGAVIVVSGLLTLAGSTSSMPAAAFGDASGSITGTVRLANGGVIAGRYVCALERFGDAVFGCTQTTSSGQYAISGVPSGEYEIDFTALPCAPQPCVSPYRRQYYDDEPSLSAANPVVVNAPQPTGDIDATLETVPTLETGAELVNEYLEHAGLAESTGSRTGTLPGAVEPPPVNPQIEREFHEHPPWEQAPAPRPPAVIAAAGVASPVGRIVAAHGGGASVQLRCNTEGDCSGSVTLTAAVTDRRFVRRAGRRQAITRVRHVVIGRAAFSLQPGATEMLRVPLTAVGRELVRRAGRRGVKVTLKTGTAKESSTVIAA